MSLRLPLLLLALCLSHSYRILPHQKQHFVKKSGAAGSVAAKCEPRTGANTCTGYGIPTGTGTGNRSPHTQTSRSLQLGDASRGENAFFPPAISPPSVDSGESSNRWKAQLMLLTVSAFYGTNFGCVKILGDALDPSVAALLRFSLAAMVFSPFLLKFMKQEKHKNLLMGGFEVGAYAAIGYYGQAQSLLTTSASTAAFICSLAVIVVPILDMIFKERPETGNQHTMLPQRQWYEPLLPAILATFGVGCLELGGAALPGVGDLWALTQPLFFGLTFWRIEKHMRQSNAQVEGAAQAFTGAMLATVALFSVFWSAHDFALPALASGNWDTVNAQLAAISSNWQLTAAILWTGIITTALTSFGENLAMKNLSASESTVIYSTEPLWGTAFASLALGESVGWNTLIGAVFILSACLWSSLGPTMSIAGGLSWLQPLLGEGVDELLENLNINLEKISEINERVP